MIIDIYTSSINGEKYLSVQKGTKIESLELPESIDSDVLSLSPFRTRLELNPEKARDALDQSYIINQIEKQGYAVHGANTVITLTRTTK